MNLYFRKYLVFTDFVQAWKKGTVAIETIQRFYQVDIHSVVSNDSFSDDDEKINYKTMHFLGI